MTRLMSGHLQDCAGRRLAAKSQHQTDTVGKSMKQYQLDGTGRLDGLVLAEVDLPRPRRGEVLVRMGAASLNYLDIKIIEGRFPVPTLGGLVPLSDGAGEVVELGEDVTRLKVGDRVASTFFPLWIAGDIPANGRTAQPGANRPGMLAEYVLFDAEALVKVPSHLSVEEASTLTCAGLTAWQIFTGPRPLLPGETLVTQGTGGVSLFAVQFAKLAGAHVVVTTSSESKAERLTQLGADAVVNYRSTPNWGREVQQNLSLGRGADHLIEIGEQGTFEQVMAAAGFNAQINLVGRANDGTLIEANSLMTGITTLRRISVGSRSSFEAMNRAIEHHKVKPVIDRVFSFGEAAEAFRYVASRGQFGKVVISFEA
jgi:NADPH:quinone reductase-like Zn-dependent oxidoreductase